jgi:hypothetical protein
MPTYKIFVFCDDCGDVHPMPITVVLNDGPVEKESVGDTYAGRALPPHLVTLSDNGVTCPKTGQLFRQKDNHQIFLVPVEESTLSRIREIMDSDPDDEPKH